VQYHSMNSSLDGLLRLSDLGSLRFHFQDTPECPQLIRHTLTSMHKRLTYSVIAVKDEGIPRIVRVVGRQNEHWKLMAYGIHLNMNVA
jgi:hypothetical protein